MSSGLITSLKKEGEKVEAMTFYFLGFQNHCRQWLWPWNEKMLAPWKESYDKLRQGIQSKGFTASKGHYSQRYGFSSSQVQMWELDNKESWEPKNWWFWIVMLWKTLGSPVDSKVIKPVNPTGNQHWIVIGKTVAEAYFSHLMWRADSLEKTLMLEKIKGKRRGWQRMGWFRSITNSMTWIWANFGR